MSSPDGTNAPTRLICPACNTRYEAGQFCARDGTPLVKDAAARGADMVGQVLADRYRVVKLLGEGGMGQVFEAQHVNINKRFAIKLLRPETVSNPEAVQRFRQEAWSASSIGHENIVEIDDFATLPNGSVYLAMEYLQGMSLAERMNHTPALTIEEALSIVLQVASGLGAAHDKGIVHRDMKPENIFLAERHGRTVAKILDFGIAKVSGNEAQSLTRTGAIFGTPHYMSPEQAIGNPLDLRSDVYSVGVIMYELFTGSVPFEAESFMGILTKHITQLPKPPRQAAPERQIPVELEAVIMKAMAKEPGERQPSMAVLYNELVAVAKLYAPALLTATGSLAVPPGSSGVLSVPVSVSALRPSTATPTPSSTVPPTSTTVPPARGSKLPMFVGLALLVLGGAGSAVWWFVLREKPPLLAVTPAAPPLLVTTPVAAKQPVDENIGPATPPPAAARDIVVDTEPTRAKILVAGKVIGETPDTVSVPIGKTLAVVLSKPGFLDEPVVLDPSKGRKAVVRLDKTSHPRTAASKKTTYQALPALPPTAPTAPPPTTAPPRTTPPVVTTPTMPQQPRPPVKPRPADPYERLDDKPASKGRGSEVLNPY